VRIVNNTFVGPIPFEGGEEALHRLQTITDNDDIWRDSMFVNNIVDHTTENVAFIGVQYGKNTPAAFKKLRSDYNCFSKPFRRYAGMDLAAWKTLGQDVNSIVANPRFRDAKSGNFRLEANSPIRATGPNPEAVTQVYNVAVGGSTSLNELHDVLGRLLQRHDAHFAPAPPVYRDFRPGDVRFSRADISKIERLLEYRPTHTVDTGLERAIAWYVARLGPARPSSAYAAAAE